MSPLPVRNMSRLVRYMTFSGSGGRPICTISLESPKSANADKRTSSYASRRYHQPQTTWRAISDPQQCPLGRHRPPHTSHPAELYLLQRSAYHPPDWGQRTLVPR